MAEYQRVVDELRFLLQDEQCELTDVLMDLIDEYARSVREVNVRLRRCGEFLRKDLRSEAVHLAEAEPNVLELVAILDFPECADLRDIASIYQLKQPEPLLIEIAEELNEAYALGQPFEKLLDRHRLLALGPAPLVKRLEVLRRLEKVDVQSTVWGDDVRIFEKARFGELEREARAAAARGDNDALKDCYQELRSDEWLEKPPERMIRTIGKQLKNVTRNHSRDQLQHLRHALFEAHSGLDLEQARTLSGEWQTAAQKAGLSEDAPIIREIEPILAWVEDENRKAAADQAYEKAVASLELALERDPSRRELERKGHQILKLNRSIPEPLGTRYHNRIAGFELAVRRHQRLVIGSAVTILVLIVGFMGILIYRNMASDEVEQITNSVEQFLNDGQLTEARKMFDEHADQLTTERALELRQRLSREESKDQERKQSFQTAMAMAEEAGTIKIALEALKKSKSLAVGSAEKLEVERLRGKWQNKQQERAANKNEVIDNLIDSVSQKLQSLDGLLEKGPGGEETLRLLSEAEKELSGLRAISVASPSRVRTQVETLESRFKKLKEHHLKQLGFLNINDRITASVSSASPAPHISRVVDEYVGLLKQYVKEFPKDPRSLGFRKSIKEQVFWNGVAAWNHQVDQWRRIDPSSGHGSPQIRIPDCEAFLKNHAACPDVAQVKNYLKFLKPVRRRELDDDGDRSEGIRSKIKELFSDPLIDKSWVLETQDGKVYYLPDKLRPEVNKNSKTVKVFHGFAGQTKFKSFLLNRVKLKSVRPAPQVKVAGEMKKMLRAIPHLPWMSFCEKSTKAVLNADDLDPFLQHFLLTRVLGYAATGSYSLEIELKKPLLVLHDEEIEPEARWMDPEDANAEKSRARARDVLVRFRRQTDMKAIWKAAAKKEETVRGQLQDRPVVVGWLAKEKKGKWACRTNWQPDRPYKLMIVLPSTDKSKSEWRQIGIADKTSMKVVPTESKLFLEGRLVFAFAKNETARRSKQ